MTSWVLLGPPGSFCLGSPGSSWVLLGPPGSSWVLLGSPGFSWDLLGPPGSSWVHLVPSAWVLLALPGFSWVLMGPSGSCWVLLQGSPGTSLVLLGPPGSTRFFLPGSSWLLFLGSSGSSWVLLGPPGSSWVLGVLLDPLGSSWVLLGPYSLVKQRSPPLCQSYAVFTAVHICVHQNTSGPHRFAYLCSMAQSLFARDNSNTLQPVMYNDQLHASTHQQDPASTEYVAKQAIKHSAWNNGKAWLGCRFIQRC